MYVSLIKFKQAVENAHQLYSRMQEAKIPAKDARFVLTQAIETQLVMTINAKELIQACSLI